MVKSRHTLILASHGIGLRRIVRELDSYRIDPYYLLNSILLCGLLTPIDSKNLCMKRYPKDPAHNIRFNHDLQLEIDCIEWALKKIEVNKIPNDRLEAVIRSTIKDVKKKRQSHEKIRYRCLMDKDRKPPMGSICYLCYKEWENGRYLKQLGHRCLIHYYFPRCFHCHLMYCPH